MHLIDLIPKYREETIRLSVVPLVKSGIILIHSLGADKMRFFNWDKISSNGFGGLTQIRVL